MRHPTRSLTIGAVLILGALGFLIYQGLSNNLVYYITPSELLAKRDANGESLRLGGQVRPGSVQLNRVSENLRFVLQDPKAAVKVISHGIPPRLFQAGAGVVVEGTFAHGIFQATNLMIKHDNTYRAPQKGQLPSSDKYVHK